MYGQNVKDSEGMFGCRTPFSTEQIPFTWAAHCENQTHKEKKEQATMTAETPLQSFFRASAAPAGRARVAAELLPANPPMVAEKQTKKVCQGVGFEMTDKDHPWTKLYEAYMYGAPKTNVHVHVRKCR